MPYVAGLLRLPPTLIHPLTLPRSASANTRLLWVWVGLLSLMAVRAGALGLAFARGMGPFWRVPPLRPKLA